MKILCLLILIVGFVSLDSCRKNSPTILAPPPLAPLDSTSHDIAWSKQILDASGSLQAVWIFNDTNAIAVGEFFLHDSLGQWDPMRYNAAFWNGVDWIPKRISAPYRGNLVTVPLDGIFGFSLSDIWLVGEGAPIHGDGTSWTLYQLWDMGTLLSTDGSVLSLWGSGATDMYFVGTKGCVVHYTGNWQKLTSGTTLDIMDIWGGTDPNTEIPVMLAAATGASPADGSKILTIEGSTITLQPTSSLSWSLSSVWFDYGRRTYVVGGGIWYIDPGESWQGGTLDLTTYYSIRVRGTAANDVFVIGAYGDILHYNGSTWINYHSQTGLVNGAYGGICVRKNLVIVVGEEFPSPVITIGRRSSN